MYRLYIYSSKCVVCVIVYMNSFTVKHISNGTESDVAQYLWLWSLCVSLLFFLARFDVCTFTSAIQSMSVIAFGHFGFFSLFSRCCGLIIVGYTRFYFICHFNRTVFDKYVVTLRDFIIELVLSGVKLKHTWHGNAFTKAYIKS